ncbi:MAG TPA: hypothetical protein VIL20_14565 [Sandaracinaceae bacterium]
MITRIRRWIARAVALAVTVVTLGRVSVEWDGVEGRARPVQDRGAIAAPLRSADEPSEPS